MLRRDFLKSSMLGSLYPVFAGCEQPVRWQRAAFRKKILFAGGDCTGRPL